MVGGQRTELGGELHAGAGPELVGVHVRRRARARMPASSTSRHWSSSKAPRSQNTSIAVARGAQASSIGPVDQVDVGRRRPSGRRARRGTCVCGVMVLRDLQERLLVVRRSARSRTSPRASSCRMRSASAASRWALREQLVGAGGAGGGDGGADAAGGVGRPGHPGLELRRPVAGEDQVGVAVDEARDQAAARRARRPRRQGCSRARRRRPSSMTRAVPSPRPDRL